MNPKPKQSITVVVDSGAQSFLWSRQECLKFGFTMNELIPVVHKMKSANRSPICIDGAIILRMSGVAPDGSLIEAAAIVYISPDAATFYLSMEVMVQLRIIHETFPQVGAAAEKQINITTVTSLETIAPCGCLHETTSSLFCVTFPTANRKCVKDERTSSQGLRVLNIQPV